MTSRHRLHDDVLRVSNPEYHRADESYSQYVSFLQQTTKRGRWLLCLSASSHLYDFQTILFQLNVR